MAHGKTLEMRKIGRPDLEVLVEHITKMNRLQRRLWSVKTGRKIPAALNTPHAGPSRDRSLAGKARIRARKAARR